MPRWLPMPSPLALCWPAAPWPALRCSPPRALGCGRRRRPASGAPSPAPSPSGAVAVHVVALVADAVGIVGADAHAVARCRRRRGSGAAAARVLAARRAHEAPFFARALAGAAALAPQPLAQLAHRLGQALARRQAARFVFHARQLVRLALQPLAAGFGIGAAGGRRSACSSRCRRCSRRSRGRAAPAADPTRMLAGARLRLVAREAALAGSSRVVGRRRRSPAVAPPLPLMPDGGWSPRRAAGRRWSPRSMARASSSAAARDRRRDRGWRRSGCARRRRPRRRARPGRRAHRSVAAPSSRGERACRCRAWPRWPAARSPACSSACGKPREVVGGLFGAAQELAQAIERLARIQAAVRQIVDGRRQRAREPVELGIAQRARPRAAPPATCVAFGVERAAGQAHARRRARRRRRCGAGGRRCRRAAAARGQRRERADAQQDRGGRERGRGARAAERCGGAGGDGARARPTASAIAARMNAVAAAVAGAPEGQRRQHAVVTGVGVGVGCAVAIARADSDARETTARSSARSTKRAQRSSGIRRSAPASAPSAATASAAAISNRGRCGGAAPHASAAPRPTDRRPPPGPAPRRRPRPRAPPALVSRRRTRARIASRATPSRTGRFYQTRGATRTVEGRTFGWRSLSTASGPSP